MTDRFDEMAGRVQMDLAAFAMPTGTSARRVIADALRAAHACGVDEAAATIDLSMDDARELRRLALLGLERDERAERIGRAVLLSFGYAPFTYDKWADALERHTLVTPARLLRAISDALKEADDAE